MDNEMIRNFSNRNYVINFITSARYDKDIDYHIYLKYIKDENLRHEFNNICIANGLLNLYYKRFNREIYNGTLYEFIKSKECLIIINAYKKIKDDERSLLSKLFGIETLKNPNIINIEDNKSLYTFGMRNFESNYRKEKHDAIFNPIKSKIEKDPNYYFTLDDKFKKNYEIIQTLLESAKYRSGNYGEVKPYITDSNQRKKLDKIIKINSYCALYLYTKTGSTNIPVEETSNESIKDIINGKLIDIKKSHPIYVIGKYSLKHIDDKYKKVLNDFIGSKGKCYKIDVILKKFPNINSSEMRKQLRILSRDAIIKNRNKKIIIGAVVLTAITLAGVATGLGINHIKELNDLKGNIENGGFYLDEYGSIDDDIFEDGLYEEALGDDAFTFITITDLKDRDKIENIISSGKKAGLIIRPNTIDFDEFNRNMTNLVIYYNYYENIDFPVLYDISILKDNMPLNCEFASQFLGVMDKLGIKAGLYGDASIYNEFNNEYNNYQDKYKNIKDFSNLANISTTDNLESNLKELSSKYNISMVRLPNGYILINKDLEYNFDGNLTTEYDLQDNETLEDVVYRYNLPVDYLCDLNHLEKAKDLGVQKTIKVPIQYSKISKIGPGSPVIANLEYGDNIIKGIDVSTWNGDIDWETLKNQGVGFVVIRIADCDKKPTDKDYILDDRLVNNIKGCIENNIPFSLYYYTRATTPEEASKEANFISNELKKIGINSGNVFVDIETEPSEAGLNETLDEKIQTNEWTKTKEECISILSSAIQGFKDNGYNLCFYCSDNVHNKIEEWFPGSTYWITSHETYDIGKPKDEKHVTETDGHRFADFSSSDIRGEYHVSKNTPMFQLCQYGKFDGIYEYDNKPQFFDLDYASENFVNNYFYTGNTIDLNLEETYVKVM